MKGGGLGITGVRVEKMKNFRPFRKQLLPFNAKQYDETFGAISNSVTSKQLVKIKENFIYK